MDDTFLYVLLAAGLFALGLYGKMVRVKKNKMYPDQKKRKKEKKKDRREYDAQE